MRRESGVDVERVGVQRTLLKSKVRMRVWSRARQTGWVTRRLRQDMDATERVYCSSLPIKGSYDTVLHTVLH